MLLCQYHVVTASADYASYAPHTDSPYFAQFEQELKKIDTLLWIVYYS